jgi:hypothetical protein
MPEGERWVDRLVDLLGDDVVQRGNFYRGHPVVDLCWPGDDPDDPEGTEEGLYDAISPRYYEDGVLVSGEERPCPRCGLVAGDADAPDPCLGLLEGVRYACCGHGTAGGGVGGAYVALDSGEVLRGRDARRFFARRGAGPGSCS